MTRDRSSRSRLVTVLGVGVVGVVLTSLALAPVSASLEESGVRVEVTYTGAERGEVVAVFRPLDAGFHLYGPGLPRDGIDGAGRPTLLEVPAGSAWSSTGAVHAEPATTLQSLPSFDRPFPIFPDGPVTLRLPVERTASAAHDAELIVSVTYMACSSRGLCLAPVIAHEIRVPT